MQVIDVAYAQAPGGAAGGGPLSIVANPLVMIVLMFVIFYFLLIRPQQKRAKEHRALLDNLKKGDKIITNGGILGEIVSISDQIMVLEVADKVRIKVGRSYVAGLAPKEG
jgi:preprotein translocase subunit YajC